MEYLFHILAMVGIYAILAVSLDILVGQTGLLSVAHGAIYGLGAYVSALMVVRTGAPFIVGLIVSVIATVIVAVGISLVSVRLRGDYFILATFCFQMILFNLLNNWTAATGGAEGISGIPRPTIFGWEIRSSGQFAALSCVLASLAFVIVRRIASSPFGRVLRAMREDEAIAEAFGKNTNQFKLGAFMVSSALAAVAGTIFAHYITYIDPSSFTVTESILVVSMVIIGGAGSSWGPIMGAALLVSLPEILRFAGMPAAIAANARQILYGTLLVIMMKYRPRGFVGQYSFRR